MNNQPSSGGGYRPPEYKKFTIYPDGGKVREISAPNIVGKHLARPSPEVEARLEARRMERKRARRNRRLLRAAAVALAFMAGFIVGFAIATETPETPLSATANAADAGPAPATEFIRSYVAPSATEPVATELTPPMNNAFELWSIERWQSETPLLQIDLDPATQWAIYYACDRDPAIFCAVMAIAYKESRFQPDTIGDGGRSVGMMQINTRWHKDRMEALGITDLTDPAQSALVAIDYLRELSTDYGLGGPDGNALYMGYNMGPDGAAKAIKSGTTSTAYSREALELYAAYMQELEAMEWPG